MQSSHLPRLILFTLVIFFLNVTGNCQLLGERLYCRVVETDARFGDSTNSWTNYLDTAVRKLTPLMYSAPAKKYFVDVRFLINRDGSITAVQALTENGYGMEEEVSKAIKAAPNWLPATRNGKNVRVYRCETFLFDVQNTTLLL